MKRPNPNRTPVIKEYEVFTKQDREDAQKLWVKHLDVYCPVVEPKEFGCRPCDLGCPCDNCSYDYRMKVPYVKDCVSRGVPITPDDAKYLEVESY